MEILINSYGMGKLYRLNGIKYFEHSKILKFELDGDDHIEIDPNNPINSSCRVTWIEEGGEVAVKDAEVRIGNNKYTFYDFSMDEVEELVRGEGFEQTGSNK